MAKINTVSTISVWTNEMEQKYEVIFNIFIEEMQRAGFVSTGHLFGQLVKASEFINAFITRYGLALTDIRNTEQVKEYLELAFQKGGELEIWKSALKRQYPIGYNSLVTMLQHNNCNVETILESTVNVPSFTIWASNCNVAISPSQTENKAYKKRELERALANCEQTSAELAWAA